MSSVLQRLSLAAMAAFTPMFAAPASADVLVVRSSGPSAGSYPPGRRLPDSTNVTLSANDSLTVLGAGGTRTLRGPGTVNVTGPVRMSPLASAISARTNRRSRLGAVRGPEGERGLWDLDATRAGTFCIRAGSRPTLWRGPGRERATLRINSTNVEWPAGRASIPWPEAVPLVHGSQYNVSLSTLPAPARLRIVTVQNLPVDPVDIGELLYRNGCQPQFEQLIASLSPA